MSTNHQRTLAFQGQSLKPIWPSVPNYHVLLLICYVTLTLAVDEERMRPAGYFPRYSSGLQVYICTVGCVTSSDVVLKADASPPGCLEAKNVDASASCQLPRYFIGLSRPQKNCLCLVLDLTASVSPWVDMVNG